MNLREDYIQLVIKNLSAGIDVSIDATKFRPDEVRRMASATVWSGKGTLIVENSDTWSQKDRDNAAAAGSPPAGSIGAESVKIRFT